MKERTGILFTGQEIMLEWLVFLAASLLFIANLASREHADAQTPPPSTQADATIVLPQDLKAQLERYKALRVASVLNPSAANVAATSAAKTQIDTQLVQWQQDVARTQQGIHTNISSDTELGSDVGSLHTKISKYSRELPKLQDNLETSKIIMSDKDYDTSLLVTKVVAITVLGLFSVFVSGVY
jgi:hypothetical protein